MVPRWRARSALGYTQGVRDTCLGSKELCIFSTVLFTAISAAYIYTWFINLFLYRERLIYPCLFSSYWSFHALLHLAVLPYPSSLEVYIRPGGVRFNCTTAYMCSMLCYMKNLFCTYHLSPSFSHPTALPTMLAAYAACYSCYWGVFLHSLA